MDFLEVLVNGYSNQIQSRYRDAETCIHTEQISHGSMCVVIGMHSGNENRTLKCKIFKLRIGKGNSGLGV